VDRFALAVILTAKPGKEKEVEAFLMSARPLAAVERGTTSWFAVRLDRGRYGIFDTFRDETGRDAHLTGEIAKALVARASELFSEPPLLYRLDVLAAKEAMAELPPKTAAA
jgi:quinol monooxygenase YgiN